MSILKAGGLQELITLGIARGIPKSVPIDVIVEKRTGHEPSKKCRRRMWRGPIPSGSLCQIGHGTYVFTPAICLLQITATIAKSLDPDLDPRFHMVVIAKLACELCGQYSLTSDGGFTQREPLVTIAELAILAIGESGTYGTGKLRKVLPWVLENLRSPKETDVFLLLCLPTELGGFALPRPLSNYDLNVSNVGVGFFAGWVTCNVDFYWPQARLVVEYDSRTYHDDKGNEKVRRDEARAEALRMLGYTVVTIKTGDLFNDRVFREKAQDIATALHEELPDATPAFVQANRILRNMLLRHDRWV